MARVIALCCFLFLSFISFSFAEVDLKRISMRNKTLITDQIIAGGPPSITDLQYARNELGVTTVIDLRDPDEGLLVHQQSTEQMGLTYINIPVTQKTISKEQADILAAELSRLDSNEKVILHCASGNRVGAVWALVEKFHHDKTPEEAIESGLKNGLRSPQLQKITERILEKDK